MTILDDIVAAKRVEVAKSKERRSLADLKSAAQQAAPPRDFYGAVAESGDGGIRLIAEIKKASPSAGVIVKNFDPIAIARTYEKHGAAAISVLTNAPFFQGDLAYIERVKAATNLPVLRKDFLIDPYQVVESRAGGADAVLLIMEVLGATGVAELMDFAKPLGLTCLVEVHTAENLRELLDRVGPPGRSRYILGINNRDLHAQRADLSTTEKLAAMVPPALPIVAESGIATAEDVERVRRAGACAILVGESLLRSQDIGAKIDSMLGNQ